MLLRLTLLAALIWLTSFAAGIRVYQTDLVLNAKEEKWAILKIADRNEKFISYPTKIGEEEAEQNMEFPPCTVLASHSVSRYKSQERDCKLKVACEGMDNGVMTGKRFMLCVARVNKRHKTVRFCQDSKAFEKKLETTSYCDLDFAPGERNTELLGITVIDEGFIIKRGSLYIPVSSGGSRPYKFSSSPGEQRESPISCSRLPTAQIEESSQATRCTLGVECTTETGGFTYYACDGIFTGFKSMTGYLCACGEMIPGKVYRMCKLNLNWDEDPDFGDVRGYQ